ncbi:Ger(x)C family spore germination protein [Neobacillus sp. 3P2-tot-E-2]|uniref:Ger(x)C family spore germination protein n=1 Tax=Neobacillus sp. 3P2-tot-E-2 TaxID=3132212 RepID=UPI0039A20346
MNYKTLVQVSVMVLILSGCWDHRELSEITVVVGMAVDKGDNGKYTLTIEGINAKELSDKTSTGFAPSIFYALEGDTLAELSQKMNVGISKNLIYSHMKVLVISEEVLRDGLIDFLDFLERNREIRDDFNLVTTRNVKAADILGVTYLVQKSSSLKLHTQLNSLVESWGGDPNIRLNDFIQAYTSAGRRGVMAALTIQGDPEKGGSVENMKKVKPDALVVVDSLAIFKHDKLGAFLPLEDSRNYLWIINKLDKTVLTVACNKDKFLGVRIFNNKTKSKVSLIKGRAVINLRVNGEGYLDSTQCKEDLTQINTFVKYGKLTEKEIKKNLEATIKKLQQEYKADIFGFGEMLYRQDYKNFKRIEKNWDEYFEDAIVNVDVNVKLRRSGVKTKSLLSEKK